MRSWEEVGVVNKAVRWGKGKKKYFWQKYFWRKFFQQKYFFSYPSPIWLPYKQPLPLLSSSSVIFEVECYVRTKDELTDRMHTRIVSFIVLDFPNILYIVCWPLMKADVNSSLILHNCFQKFCFWNLILCSFPMVKKLFLLW